MANDAIVQSDTHLAPNDPDGEPGAGEVGPLEMQVRQIDPDLALPAYAKPGDAGLDLRSTIDVTLDPGGGRALVPTGLAVAIPAGHAGFVLPRTGLALRSGVTVTNAPGLIDAGYRGELRVILANTDPHEAVEVKRGDRIAQLVVQRVAHVTLVPVDELSPSERGEGGFGHSGR